MSWTNYSIPWAAYDANSNEMGNAAASRPLGNGNDNPTPSKHGCVDMVEHVRLNYPQAGSRFLVLHHHLFHVLDLCHHHNHQCSIHSIILDQRIGLRVHLCIHLVHPLKHTYVLNFMVENRIVLNETKPSNFFNRFLVFFFSLSLSLPVSLLLSL